jgi:hypothetical protein
MIMGGELFGNVTWDEDSRWSGIMMLANGKTAAFEIDGDEPVESLTEAAGRLRRCHSVLPLGAVIEPDRGGNRDYVCGDDDRTFRLDPNG